MASKFIRKDFHSYLHSLPPALLIFIADFFVKAVNLITIAVMLNTRRPFPKTEKDHPVTSVKM
jgi:hypothetical protein